MSITIDPEADGKRRFSRRVADYVLYRPRYPRAILETLIAEAGITPASVVADIGSGTGFSAELFLDYGCTVIGVEPNDDMRAAGDEYLARYATFSSRNASAEATSLPDNSVDLVTAGQALHWFDLPAAAREFARILKPGGHIAFFWNTRDVDASPFMRAYEALVQEYNSDFKRIHHSNVDMARKALLFRGGAYAERHFPWILPSSAEMLIGRTLSSSYMPGRDHPRAEAMLNDLNALFARFQQAGAVPFAYVAELYFGSPVAAA